MGRLAQWRVGLSLLGFAVGACTARGIDDGRTEAIETTCATYCPTFMECSSRRVWDTVEDCVDACEMDLVEAARAACFEPQVEALQCIGALNCEDFATRLAVADVYAETYPCKAEAVAELDCRLDR